LDGNFEISTGAEVDVPALADVDGVGGEADWELAGETKRAAVAMRTSALRRRGCTWRAVML
jgi:hypothetical protein